MEQDNPTTQDPTQTQDTTQTSQLDPTVVNLAKAIRQTETGGDFSATGKSGEYGAYQFTNDTWNKEAPKYGVTVPLSQATPGQQNAVAYNKIKEWKDAGNNVTQIASMWNAGEGEPNAYTGTFADGSPATGVNKFGVKYDVPTYAKSVAQAYLTLKNGGQISADASNPSSTANTSPTQVVPQNQSVPSKGDFLDKAAGFFNTLFPGKQVGNLLGGLYDKLTLPSDEAKEVTLPSAAQVGADVGQGALMLAAGPEAGELGTAGRIAGAAGGGALYGAAGAVANGSTDIKDIGTQAAIGGGIGAATGGLLEAGGAAVRGIGDMLSSKSADEIATMARDPNVTTKDISKLSAPEQEQYFKEKTQAVNEDAITQRTARTQETAQAVNDSKQEIQQFAQKAGEAARGETTDLKQPLQQLLKDSSQTYVQLTQEAAASGEGLDKKIDTEDLKDAIDKKFEYDQTGLGDEIKNDLGLNKPEPEPETDEATGLPVIKAEASEPDTITNQEILDKAKEIMQTVSKGSRAGNQTYSAAEYRALQKYSFLMETLGDNGIDMTEANKFWRSWAPLRNRSVAEIKPFEEAGVGKMPFESTVAKANATANTIPQAKAKLDAQNFISELENRMGLEKGTIGSDTRDAIAQLEKAKLDKAEIPRIAQEAKDAIAADKAAAIKEIGKQKYNAQAASRKRAIIKKTILYTLGAIGVTGGAARIISSVL